jgi:hypothetical protein
VRTNNNIEYLDMKMRDALAHYESFQKLITSPCIEEADIKN